MKFKRRSLSEIADMICGNFDSETSVFQYRSSSALTDFFADADTDFVHDGSTRKRWVAETLETILDQPSISPDLPPDTFLRVVNTLMDQADAFNEDRYRSKALGMLNNVLSREGFQAFYGEDNNCYLLNKGTSHRLLPQVNPHRPLSEGELLRRKQFEDFLEICTEDQLIEDVLVPLFRQLGFSRISVTGHKDKALEYGKDLWMRYTLPTQHLLYFGLQAKKGKLDSSGRSIGSNSNIAEILNQTTMMLGHEIFDPEVSKRVLVDHAFIACGGEITKAAKNWLGNRLDANKRSQVLFMDRDDIVNLCIVAKIPLPADSEASEITPVDDFPF
ncbi:hypothetical protein ACTL6U_07875 [Rhodovibrionaceae bacterium A322]